MVVEAAATASETTSLLAITNGNGSIHPHDASSSSHNNGSINQPFNRLFVGIQCALIVLFVIGTEYKTTTSTSTSDATEIYNVKEYIAFRDIMAMLLLGFGYLMTFLKHYGLGAVGFTLMLSILAMQLNLFVEHGVQCFYDNFIGTKDVDEYFEGDLGAGWPITVDMSALIDSEFAAATLMITYGALIGRTTPFQLVVVALVQSFFYAFNKVVLVLGVIAAEDVGGSMTIHMFGAYFGLAVSYALGNSTNQQEDRKEGQEQEEIEKEEEEAKLPDKVSDIMALIGTTILWVYWPSFVGATETATPEYEGRCIVNTVLALLASTTVTFLLSPNLNAHSKYDPVHVANSTLAGGVAIGSIGRMSVGPGMAVVTGTLAGAASVYGYVYSTPYLEQRFNMYDTCGVGNLHGYPSVVGALLSIVFVAFDTSDTEFLLHDTVGMQMISQVLGIVATLVVSIASGYGTGLFLSSSSLFLDPLPSKKTTKYQDQVWWHLEY